MWGKRAYLHQVTAEVGLAARDGGQQGEQEEERGLGSGAHVWVSVVVRVKQALCGPHTTTRGKWQVSISHPTPRMPAGASRSG